MIEQKIQPNYSSISHNPVLAIPELNTKFGISIFSNSLVNLLGDLNEARILQQLHWWITQDYGVDLKGFRWIYKSIAEWIKDALPDLTQWKARSAVLRLEAKGIIIREKLHKEHHGHTYHTKNQTYYYRINYKQLQKLISDRLEELGIDRVDEQQPFVNNQQTIEAVNPLVSSFVKNPNTSFLADPNTSFLADPNTSFLDCQKTDQNNYQNKQHTHIEGDGSAKDSTREQDREAIDHLGSESEIKINPSASTRNPEKDNVPSPVLRNNTERVTGKSNEYQHGDWTSWGNPSVPHHQVTSSKCREELVTRNSLPVTRKYDRALGVNPPEQQKDVQQRSFSWMPEGEWCVNGKLDPHFHEWLAQDWFKQWGGNLDRTKSNVLLNFKKDPANIAIRWEEYRSQVLKRYDNASLRMANGVELKKEEQQELVRHSRAIENPLREEHSVVASLTEASTSNLILGEVVNGELLPSKDESNKYQVTSNECGEELETHNSLAVTPKREIPKTKDGTFAENPEAYQLYQEEKIENPANLGDLVARLRKATKGLANKFTMPMAEPPKQEKPLHIMSIEEVNELLQDRVMRAELLPKLHKSDRFEVFCNELGEVEFVDYSF